MSGTLDILELAIAITAKNHNPTVLNSDFLKYSGIVPSDWELARPPVFSAQAAQVVFKNGVNIVAQVGQVNFAENLTQGGESESKIETVAEKYVRTLPQADYRVLDINFRRLLALGEDENTTRDFIVNKLLAPGSWTTYGNAPVRATVNFVYSLDEGQLNLNINEARLNLQDQQKSLSAAMFTGVFRYQLPGEAAETRLDDLCQRIKNWKTNLRAFHSVVNEELLQGAGVNPILVVRDA
jgi:hypothetical protein